MEIRQVGEEDRAAMMRLMAEAFGGGRRPTADDVAVQPILSLHLGAFEGSALVAAATVHNLHVAWGSDHEAPMGGVAGVACTVGARGQGHVAALLARALHDMHVAGQYLSGLYPFSYAFYRRHGWEWVGEKRRYSVPTAAIVSAPEGRDVRTYDGPEALEVVKPVYAAFVRRYHGMTTRADAAPDWWTGSLTHQGERTTYVHVHHDPVTDEADGYFTFRYPDGGQPACLGEFFALNPAAYRGLLSVMHYYGTQIKTLEFAAPADDPLTLHVMHNDLSTSVNPLFMGRIVDVAAALSALRPLPAVRGTCILQVVDNACDWNHGCFEIGVEEGRVTVKASEKTSGVALDISALTQAYWGQPSLPLLRQAGRVEVADEGQYHLLAGLLPPAIAYLQDFF
jgi:predicted acetyltransferase